MNKDQKDAARLTQQVDQLMAMAPEAMAKIDGLGDEVKASMFRSFAEIEALPYESKFRVFKALVDVMETVIFRDGIQPPLVFVTGMAGSMYDLFSIEDAEEIIKSAIEQAKQ